MTTVAHGGFEFHDVFLFDTLPGGQWGAVVVVLVGWVVVHRLLKQRRRRDRLRRRREIRARLYAADIAPAAAPDVPPAPPAAPVIPVTPVAELHEIDLTDSGVVIDLRDGAVFGSEVTLESGDILESGIVGPFPAD